MLGCCISTVCVFFFGYVCACVCVYMRKEMSSFLRYAFGVALAVNMLWVAAVCKLVSLGQFTLKTSTGLAVLSVHFCWRLSLFLCPWISLEKSTTYEANASKLVAQVKKNKEARKNGKKATPVFVLGNHTSFLDTILTASQLPSIAMYQARTYMGAHLFKLPILSTVCRACGHFPVFFTSDKDGVFAVDREKMAETEKLVDTHINSGGILCFFPEGQMNPNPDTMMSFRYGGMKKALVNDAILWSLVTCGNPDIWPRKAQLGGFPGRVKYSLECIAPDGCNALVSELKGKKAEYKDTADHVILAEYCRDIMQKDYDGMRSNDTKKEN